jgi:hypothetical protein
MLLEKQPKKFDPGPEIGDTQAADGAMTSHGKNHGKKFFKPRQCAYFWKALYLRT